LPDTTPPLPPSANINAAGNQITGTSEPGADITILNADSVVIARGVCDADGNFTIELNPPIIDGSVVGVEATDAAGNTSPTTYTNSSDFVAPDAPRDVQMAPLGETLTGKAEPGSNIEVKDAAGSVIGIGTTNQDGNFSVTLSPPMANGEAVYVTATDAAGNQSPSAMIITPDNTAPDAPTDLNVGNDGTIVSGLAEPNSRIEIRDPNGNTIGTGATDASGHFVVTLSSPMKNGENLSVTATDSSGNRSFPSPATAPDITAPDAPSNLVVNPEGVVLTGHAEPNSTIEVRDAEGRYIGIGITDPNGNFSITLDKPYTSGERLTVTAMDPAGNTSPSSNVTAPTIDVPCFVHGTLIATEHGQRPIEDLCPGDLVLTRDHGLQPVRWIGSRRLDAASLQGKNDLRPIRIRANAIGPSLPSKDLLVSPQHRILVRSKIAQRMFGTIEVLVAAKQLLPLDGVEIADDLVDVEYFHLLFDQHEILFSNGAETESLFTGPEAMKAIGAAARAEIYELFPMLEHDLTEKPPARQFLSAPQARKLADRHLAKSRSLTM